MLPFGTGNTEKFTAAEIISNRKGNDSGKEAALPLTRVPPERRMDPTSDEMLRCPHPPTPPPEFFPNTVQDPC